MNSLRQSLRRPPWWAALSCVLCLGMVRGAVLAETPTQVLVVVGPSNHPPGTHEVAAGARLLKYALESATNVSDLHAEVVEGWPTDATVVERAATIVFTGDQFPPARLPNSASIMDSIQRAVDRGAGVVCIHYATGLAAGDVGDDGDHPLLRWTGGYFATRCRHHQSVAKVYPAATISPASVDHPIARGWREFTVHDEPYINNYFGPNNRLGPGVTAIASAQLPPNAPSTEIVAWAVQRPDGGRGFGIVMPHFYMNWAVDDLRTCILNGVVWSAGREVPATGVQTAALDLASFGAAALEPQPRPVPVKKPTSGTVVP